MLHALLSPIAGVSLFFIELDRGSVSECTLLPNVTILNANTISSSAGLACVSRRNEPRVGEWFYPDGTIVEGLSSADSLYVLQRIQRVDLFRRGPLPVTNEGIYTCRILDESGGIRNLYVGIYAGGGGPGGPLCMLCYCSISRSPKVV